jgi:hypothetical protein
MPRNLLSRLGTLTAGAAILAGAALNTSCGGSSSHAAEMVLVEFLFVDRALNPTAPTGAQSLPRNAQILLKFSEQVSASTVTNQTIQLRYNSTLIPQGSFSVNGSQVRFDPTVTSQGQPNPTGFEPVTQYNVFIPSFQDDQADGQIAGVVENRDADPNTTTFRTAFETGSGWLRELDPPKVEECFFIPEPNALTGNIPGGGQMVFQFSEPMDPASFILGPSVLPVTPSTTIDVRYDELEQVNVDNGLAGAAVPGYFTFDPSLTLAFFNPTFSFGNKQFVLYSQCYQGLKDLAGNLLVNPRSFGNFRCDGLGQVPGKLLVETFEFSNDRDGANTDADWGSGIPLTLQGQPVSVRFAYKFGYVETVNPADLNCGPNGGLPCASRGQYAAMVDPLTGAALNGGAVINPPTNLGRRVMLAFSDVELGAAGTITAVAWGPDSNATFAALYPNLYLRMGYQSIDSMNLATTFGGNWAGGQGLVVYNGQYAVGQVMNVGNTPGHPAFAHEGPYRDNPGCTLPNAPSIANWNLPLYTYTGFTPWPTLTTYFDWTPGNPNVDEDSIMLFDMSAQEGDTWQQFRVWFASTFPCSGFIIGGYPQRRLYSVYEEDTAIPTANVNAGVLNPEPTVYDTCFTVTKRVSVAQSLFYTYPGFISQALGGSTFGDNSDYLPAQLTPQVQDGGADVRIEFEAADFVGTDRRTILPGGDTQTWTDDINECDGIRCIRWRVQLISNLISNKVAKLTRIVLPIVSF